MLRRHPACGYIRGICRPTTAFLLPLKIHSHKKAFIAGLIFMGEAFLTKGLFPWGLIFVGGFWGLLPTPPSPAVPPGRKWLLPRVMPQLRVETHAESIIAEITLPAGRLEACATAKVFSCQFLSKLGIFYLVLSKMRKQTGSTAKSCRLLFKKNRRTIGCLKWAQNLILSTTPQIRQKSS